MKKIWRYRSKKGLLPFGPSSSPGRDRGHPRTNFCLGYHIRDKELGKIHKAASLGNVDKVQQLLFLRKNGLNDRDKLNRTALHWACAKGHSAVVTFLLERKCLLHLQDNENRTALLKAVECQEEECATLLLQHGADPNIVDSYGKTALHYAVLYENLSLTEKLLSYNANIEARDEDDQTPLLLAIRERKLQMVKFLVEKGANIHAVDKMKRTALMLAIQFECIDIASLLLQRGADMFSQDVCGLTAEEYAATSGFNIIGQLISEYKEKRPKTPPEKSEPVDESSEEDSLSRFSNKPGVDSWHTSDDEIFDFETKYVPKPNLRKLFEAYQQSTGNKAKCGIVRQESTAFSEHNNAASEIEDVVETFPKPSRWFEGSSHPAFPRLDPLPKPLETPAGLGLTKERATKSELVKKDGDTHIIERAPQGEANHDHLTSVDRAHKNDRRDMMPAVGLGEEEDTDSPWDSEERSTKSELVEKDGDTHIIESAPQGEANHDHLTSVDRAHKNDRRDMMPAVGLGEEEDTDSPWDSEVEEETKHKSSEVEVSANVCDAAAESRRLQQRKPGGNNKQAFPAPEKKGSDSSNPGVSRKEIEQKNNDKWTPEKCVIAPVFEKTSSLTDDLLHVNDDSILKKVDQDDGRPARKTAYEKKKVSDSGRKAKGLLCKHHMQDEIAMPRQEIDSVKSQNQEKEKKYFEDMKIVKGEKDYPQKAITLNKETLTKTIFQHTGQLNVPIAENTVLNPELENAKQSKQRLETEVESCHAKLAAGIHDHDQGQPLQRNLDLSSRKAKDKRLRLQDQRKFDMAQLKGVNEMLSQQLSKMKSEFNKLKIELHQTRDDHREKTLMLERVQRDLRQAECQKQETEQNRADSKEETVISIQDQFLHILRQLHAESQKQSLMLEEGNKVLVNIWNHVKEKMCHNENKRAEREVSDSARKAKGLLCKNHMQDEIAMPRQEIDSVKSQNQEKEKKYFEDMKIVKGEKDYPQKAITLNKETLTKTIFQHTGQLNVPIAENTVLNPELENAKQSKQRLETEVESCHAKLAAGIHDHDQGQPSQRDLELSSRKAKDERLRLQDQRKFDMAQLKGVNEMLSQQLSKMKSEFNKLKIKLHQMSDDHREKTLMLERVQRELRQVECQKQEIEHMFQNEQGKVNEYRGKQESLEERLSQVQRENMLLRQQLEDAPNRADSKEEALISMQHQLLQILEKPHAEREKQGPMLKESNKELVNIPNHVNEKMSDNENKKAERELQEAEDQYTEAMRCAEKTQDHIQKVEMKNVELQATVKKREGKIEQLQENLLSVRPIQAASQEEHIASIRSQMELRMKDLESELSKMKTSQDSNKAELEKYKQLYLEELKVRQSLENKLDKTDERLAKMSTKLELKRQQNRYLLSTFTTRPVLAAPCFGHFNGTVMFNSDLYPRANMEFSTSVPLPSSNSMVTYLLETQRKEEERLSRELEEGAAEFESEFSRLSSLLYTGGSNLYQDRPVKTSK